MPNMLYFRPCDGEEVLGAWRAALRAKKTPSFISVARDPTGNVPGTSRDNVTRGAYIVLEHERDTVTLVSCGSNLHYAIAAAQSLSEKHNVDCRVVSAPCLRLFDQQSEEYQREVIPWDDTPVISIEEYVPISWAKYASASVGMKDFGYSASNESNYARFGLDAVGVEAKVLRYLEELGGRNARMVPWRLLS
jgi:dihydroxyacetone synthase